MDNAFENLKLVFDSPPESGARARNEPEGPAHVQESPLMRFRVQSKGQYCKASLK